MQRFSLRLQAICLAICLVGSSAWGAAIIADHNAADEFPSIPDSVIQVIGADYHVYYVHTSHGSQIMTGIDMLQDEDATYAPPFFYEYGDDLGHSGDTSWVPNTRSYLDSHPECNMAMFSWCGGCSDNTETGIDIYLAKMEELEADYPAVIFIYMTGHLDGTGPEGNLYARNNQIRDYCTTNEKVLFDFADVESYDPDGTYYPDETDYCYWCYDWCAVHTCPGCAGCAHSHCFNCYRKGKAWWWMMARVSGWSATPDTAPQVVATSPTQNQLAVPVDNNIAVTFDIDMDETSLTDATVFVHAHLTGLHAAAISYDPPTRTATIDPDEDLAWGDVATVTLTTGIESSAGTPMESPYVWSFTCATQTAPAVFAYRDSYASGEYPRSVYAGDLDGDGDMDIASIAVDGVHVRWNDGAGTFPSETLHSVGEWPLDISGGDLDGDGDLDLVTTNETSEYSDYISVLLNDGSGGFAPFVTYPSADAGSNPTAIALADMDGDGDLDVAAAFNKWSYGTVSIIPNNGNGTFGDYTSFPAGNGCVGICVGDFDSDFDMDVATVNVNAWPDNMTVLMNDGDATLAAPVHYNTADNPWCINAGDLDADGAPDLVAGSEDGEYIGYMSTVPNNGDGTFGPYTSYVLGFGAWANAVADLDGDGDLDGAFACSNRAASVRLNNGDGTFGPCTAFETGYYPTGICAADLDGDGDLDLATADQGDNTVTVLFNRAYTGPVWHVNRYYGDDSSVGDESNPFRTIQRGIDAASNGDTVMVHGGTTFTGDGNRDLDFGGRGIVVMTYPGHPYVTIDCQGSEPEPHRAFDFHSGEDSTAILRDIIITGAYSDSGAIFITNATPSIINCEITGNSASGIRCDPSWPWPNGMYIDRCTITNNTGHGIKMWNARLSITDSEISGNDSNGVSLEWSGMCSLERCLVVRNGETGFWAFTMGESFTLINCTFARNKRGLWWDANYPLNTGEVEGERQDDTGHIENCIFAFNQEEGVEYGWDPPFAVAFCNDSYGNDSGDWVNVPWGPGDTLGNLSEDPLFCDTAAEDYRVSGSSPCAPANNDCGVLIGARGIGCGECCLPPIRGNVNYDPEDLINIIDLTYYVAWLFGEGSPPPCYEEADLNADGALGIPDVTYLVAYLFGGGDAPWPCP